MTNQLNINDMNCQTFVGDHCRDDLCRKNPSGYYVRVDITNNFMVGLSDNYRIKVTDKHAWSINNYDYICNGEVLTLINKQNSNIYYTFTIGSVIPSNSNLFTSQFHGKTIQWLGYPK